MSPATAIPSPSVALRPGLYVRSFPQPRAARQARGCRESSGKSELIDALGRDAEELGDGRHLPQLDLVPAEENVSELRESVPMQDQLGCRGRIPLAPIAGKDGLKKSLDTTKSKLAGGPVGVGEGPGLNLPFGVGAPADPARWEANGRVGPASLGSRSHRPGPAGGPTTARAGL